MANPDDQKPKQRDAAESAELRATRFTVGDEEVAVISFEPYGARRADSRLTPTENEVARLVLEGLSNAEISRLRGTSARTVANQVASLLEKLGIASRFDLAGVLGRQT